LATIAWFRRPSILAHRDAFWDRSPGSTLAKADFFFFLRPRPDESSCGMMLWLSFAAPLS